MADETPLAETQFSFSTRAVPASSWQVVHFRASERVSDLYELAVVLAMEPGGATLEGLLGLDAALEIERGPTPRCVRGIVRRVEELGATALHRFVRVDVVPALWNLSQRVDQRIFQHQNVVEIVQSVLRNAGLYQGAGQLRVDASLQSLPPREYCVQYQETDLDFVRRLLDDEGIPFYFDHGDSGADGEAWVLAGDTHAYPPVPTPDGSTVSVLDEGTRTHGSETVRWFDESHELRPTSVMVRDFDFSRPRNDLSPSFPARPGPRPIYEYPARASLTHYDDDARTYQTENTTRLAKVRAEEHQTREHLGRGRGNVTGFMAGRSFTLQGSELEELDRAYLLGSVDHVGQAWAELPEDVRSSERIMEVLREAGVVIPDDTRRAVERYHNRFGTFRVGGIATSVPFRPARTIRRPIVEGPQTAWVVGPAGEEIHTDPHGRIKVQFHWDRQGVADDNSSCWIRVAQSSSGSGWGFTILPRIGMEVVVGFLEGDPDRPLVMGCVNNGENGSSYPLPDAKTKSTIKTYTSPRNGGYNEIRFEDAAGSEQMYVQAERDHDTFVKNDQSLTINRHRTKTVHGDERNTLMQNRVTDIRENNLLTVEGNHDVEVHGAVGASTSVDQVWQVSVGARLEIENSGNRFVMNHDGGDLIELNAARTHTVTVGENQSITVGGSRVSDVAVAETHTVGAGQTISVGGVRALNVGAVESTTVGADRTVKVGQNLSTQVGKNRTTTVGGNDTQSVKKNRTATVSKNDVLSVSGSQQVTVTGLMGASVNAATMYSASAGLSLSLQCGASSIVMTPDKITIQSPTVEVLGKKLVVVEGGLVKINCGGGGAAPAKGGAAGSGGSGGGIMGLLGKINQGLDKLLAKLPAPLAKILKNVGENAVKSMLGALAQGQMPDFGAIGRDALHGAAGMAIGEAFGALSQAGIPGDNPVAKALFGKAQEKVMDAVTKGIDGAGLFRQSMAPNKAWQKAEQKNPEAVAQVLQTVARPIMMRDLRQIPMPEEAGVVGERIVDASGRAGSRGLRGGIAMMLTDQSVVQTAMNRAVR